MQMQTDKTNPRRHAAEALGRQNRPCPRCNAAARCGKTQRERDKKTSQDHEVASQIDRPRIRRGNNVHGDSHGDAASPRKVPKKIEETKGLKFMTPWRRLGVGGASGIGRAASTAGISAGQWLEAIVMVFSSLCQGERPGMCRRPCMELIEPCPARPSQAKASQARLRLGGGDGAEAETAQRRRWGRGRGPGRGRDADREARKGQPDAAGMGKWAGLGPCSHSSL